MRNFLQNAANAAEPFDRGRNGNTLSSTARFGPAFNVSSVLKLFRKFHAYERPLQIVDGWLPQLDLFAALVAIAISIYALYSQRASESRQRALSAKQRKLSLTISFVSEQRILYLAVRRELLVAKSSLEEGHFVPPSAAPSLATFTSEDERLTREVLATSDTITAEGGQLLAARTQIVLDRWSNLVRTQGVAGQQESEQAINRLVKAIDDLVCLLDSDIEVTARQMASWLGE